MGISSKWIKSLVGIKKHGKTQNGESSKERNSSAQLLHKRKHSMDTEGALAVAELTGQIEPLASDTNAQTISDSTSSSRTKEDQAATVIQSAFRTFLARRALRALKGLVTLQALVRGHAVRKQAAETLQCMQSLVKVQARVRARQVRVALEGQVTQKKASENVHEDQAREIEERWCGSIGSVEEMQAKALKKQEAAAKRGSDQAEKICLDSMHVEALRRWTRSKSLSRSTTHPCLLGPGLNEQSKFTPDVEDQLV